MYLYYSNIPQNFSLLPAGDYTIQARQDIEKLYPSRKFPEKEDYFFFSSLTLLNLEAIRLSLGNYKIQKIHTEPATFNPTETKITIFAYKQLLYTLLETKAVERNNISSLELLSWQTSSIPRFKKEAVAFNTWRDIIFDQPITNARTEIQAGTPIDFEVFLASLPTFESILATTVV